MSVVLGIYDLYAYIIPGLLYLYVINEFLRITGGNYLNYADVLDSSTGVGLATLALIVIAAHLLGQLCDPLARRIIYLVPKSEKPTVTALNTMTTRHPNLDIRFEGKDWTLLFALLRQRNLELVQTIDTFQANSMMFRNLFLGLLLAIVFQILVLAGSSSPGGLAILALTALLCILSYLRSRMFNLWFFTLIFQSSLEYGRSLEDALSFSTNEPAKAERPEFGKPRKRRA